MSQYCTQCGIENENDAKFCKSCGLLLTRKMEVEEQLAEQVEQSVESIECKAEQTTAVEPMKSSMLLIFPVLWMIYYLIFVRYGVIMIETIAEALGGVVVILGIPLIITSIVNLIKKSNSTSYPNFVMHTFIGTIIIFFLAIAGDINTKIDEYRSNNSEYPSSVGVEPSRDTLPRGFLSKLECSDMRAIRQHIDFKSYTYAGTSEENSKIFFDQDSISINWLKSIIKVRVLWMYSKENNDANKEILHTKPITVGDTTYPGMPFQFRPDFGYAISVMSFNTSDEQYKTISKTVYKCDGTVIGQFGDDTWNDYLSDSIIASIPIKILHNEYLRFAYIIVFFILFLVSVFGVWYYKNRIKQQ